MKDNEKISSEEVELHKKFKLWDEITTFTRYLLVFSLGMLGLNLGSIPYIFIFVLCMFLNAFCYYSMKYIFERMVNERVAVNYGKKKGI